MSLTTLGRTAGFGVAYLSVVGGATMLLFTLWGPAGETISDFTWNGDPSKPRAVHETTYGVAKFMTRRSLIYYPSGNPSSQHAITKTSINYTPLVETLVGTVAAGWFAWVLIARLRRRAT